MSNAAVGVDVGHLAVAAGAVRVGQGNVRKGKTNWLRRQVTVLTNKMDPRPRIRDRTHVH